MPTKVFVKGQIPWNKGIRIPEGKRGGRPLGSLDSHPRSEEWRQAHMGSRETPWLIGRVVTPETREKIAASQRGSLSPNWRGGRSTEVQLARNRTRSWAIAVKIRDNYTCQICGATDVKVQADHIKPLKFFPELAKDLSNGRTLCLPCHVKTPSFGYRIFRS